MVLVGLGSGRASNHERGQRIAQRRPPAAWSFAQIREQRLDFVQRPSIDEPNVAMLGRQSARRLGFTTDVNARPRAVSSRGAEHVVAHLKVASRMIDSLAAKQRLDDAQPLASI